MSNPIIILGEEITEENFPVMYKWATVNKAGLEKTIKGMMEKDGSSAATNLITLESDMQTDES